MALAVVGVLGQDDLRTLDRGDDVGERDLLGRARQHVAAADAPLRAHEARALHRQEDLLEVGLREVGALGDLLHGGRTVRAVERERQQRPGGVVAARRHPHAPIVARKAARASPRPRSTLRPMTSSLVGAVRPALDGASDRGTGPGAPGRPGRLLAAGAGAEAEAVVLLVLDGLGLERAARARRRHARARGHGGRPDHDGRARDDGLRAHLDRDRARARAARDPRLPHARRRATC